MFYQRADHRNAEVETLVIMLGLIVFVCAVSAWFTGLPDGSIGFTLVWSVVSMTTTLFPLQIAAGGAAGMLALFYLGAPVTVFSVGGYALGILGIVGLLGFIYRQFGTHVALNRAIGELGLSIPYDNRVLPQMQALLRPLNIRADEVERLANIAYGTAGARNRLDIYRSLIANDTGRQCPVLLQIHGSGWMVGSKDHQALPLIYHMAKNGWVVVSINYRLSPAARFPAHLVDVKKAIAWVRGNIQQYGGDPRYIAVTGGSAGGHLAALAALTPGAADLQPGFEEANTALAAVVPLYGRYDFLCRDEATRRRQILVRFLGRYIMPASVEDHPDLWRLASPVDLVSVAAPPFFLIHGTGDSLVPAKGARMFFERLRAVSKMPVIYAELKGMQHGYDIVRSPATEYTIRAIHQFLELQHKHYLEHERETRHTSGGTP